MTRIDNFSDLDHWLLEQSERYANESHDEDHQTDDARQRALGKVSIISELRVAIARKVADDLLERLLEPPRVANPRTIREQYRDQYGDDPLAPYQAEGR